MSSASAILNIVRQIQQDLDELGCNKCTSSINAGSCDLYNEIVTNKTLRKLVLEKEEIRSN